MRGKQIAPAGSDHLIVTVEMQIMSDHQRQPAQDVVVEDLLGPRRIRRRQVVFDDAFRRVERDLRALAVLRVQMAAEVGPNENDEEDEWQEHDRGDVYRGARAEIEAAREPPHGGKNQRQRSDDCHNENKCDRPDRNASRAAHLLTQRWNL